MSNDQTPPDSTSRIMHNLHQAGRRWTRVDALFAELCTEFQADFAAAPTCEALIDSDLVSLIVRSILGFVTEGVESAASMAFRCEPCGLRDGRLVITIDRVGAPRLADSGLNLFATGALAETGQLIQSCDGFASASPTEHGERLALVIKTPTRLVNED
ncbi:MAG: hypothetical protein PF961_01365 [Planctomycetota bacterium]|jgi:hypothetical protein|nr:hypothetical protein [Planctomycetota bacterium]